MLVNNIKSYNKQNVNFKMSLSSLKPEEIIRADGIFRKNMFGLKMERIDFFKNTKKVQQYVRELPAKNGNPGRSTYIDFLIDKNKSINTHSYKSDFLSGRRPVKESIKNYSNKKLTLKEKKWHGEDKNGRYYTEMITEYYNDGKTPKMNYQIKWYKYTDKEGLIRFKEPLKIKTNFNEQGIRTTESRPTSYGKEIKVFDSEGKNVIQTIPEGQDNSISYYGQFGYYTPGTGMQTY